MQKKSRLMQDKLLCTKKILAIRVFGKEVLIKPAIEERITVRITYLYPNSAIP